MMIINFDDFCYTMIFLLTGPPGNVTDLNISAIIACSMVAQWSRLSSDPVCGTVWYTVTVSSEGGVMIITDNTTMTSYDVTGLNDNTVYHVSVTASNSAGSRSVTMMTVTNSIGKCRLAILSIFVYNSQFSVHNTLWFVFCNILMTVITIN